MIAIERHGEVRSLARTVPPIAGHAIFILFLFSPHIAEVILLPPSGMIVRIVHNTIRCLSAHSSSASSSLALYLVAPDHGRPATLPPPHPHPVPCAAQPINPKRNIQQVSIGVLFWQFANDIVPVAQAKRFYPMFGQMSSLAPVVAGLCVVRFTSAASGAEGKGKAVTEGLLDFVLVRCLFTKPTNIRYSIHEISQYDIPTRQTNRFRSGGVSTAQTNGYRGVALCVGCFCCV